MLRGDRSDNLLRKFSDPFYQRQLFFVQEVMNRHGEPFVAGVTLIVAVVGVLTGNSQNSLVKLYLLAIGYVIANGAIPGRVELMLHLISFYGQYSMTRGDCAGIRD